MVRALEDSLDSLDAPWLARLETLQLNYPRVADLQYLVAMACMQRQLWGKAQQLMAQAVLGLSDPALLRSGWRVLAQLATQRGDDKAALAAWQRAARD
jgi:HemY protein